MKIKKTALAISVLPTLMGFQQQQAPPIATHPTTQIVLRVNDTSGLLLQQDTQPSLTAYRQIIDDLKQKRDEAIAKQQQIELELQRKRLAIEQHKEQLLYEKNHVHFNSINVTEVSNISAETLRKGLPDNMKQMAESIIQVEKEYGINAIFISAVAKHESGNGTSKAFQYLNNAFGIGPNKYFGSYDKAVEYFGDLMNEYYIQPNGQYYKGKSISAIAVTYCQDGTDWSSLVTQNAHDIIDKIKTTP